MRAIQIVRIGLPATALRIVDLPEPEGGPGRVRIAVRAFGINYADLLARTGMDPESPPLPFVPGQEVAGTVLDDGEGGSRFPAGTRVAALTFLGGYAEVAVARPEFVVPLPPGLAFEPAASVPAAGATAWLAVKGLGSARPGDRILVHAAAGGVGTLAVQLARDLGCVVLGTVGSPGKVRALEGLGVEHPMDHSLLDVEAEVLAATGGAGLDLVLDSPRHDTLGMDIRLLAPSGRLVITGAGGSSSTVGRRIRGDAWARQRLPGETLDAWGLGAEGKGVIGIHLRRIADARPALVAAALQEIVALVAAGRVVPQLDRVVPFDSIAEAHERLHGRDSIGKIVVTLASPGGLG